MSTSTINNQATLGAEAGITDESLQQSIASDESSILTKSSVVDRPDPLLSSARFKKYDIVHFAGSLGGRRIKVTGEVYKSRYNKDRHFVEHQLKDLLTGKLSQSGTWFRDGDLKLDRPATTER